MACVRRVMAAATLPGRSAGSADRRRPGPGRHRCADAASAVAMKVLAGMITSPRGRTPTARSASSRASVPLATPTQWSTLMVSAYACSNSSPPCHR